MLQNSPKLLPDSWGGGTGPCAPRHRLMGKHPSRCRAGIYPPTFFSPGPAEQIPPGEGSAARRGGNNNNTMASPRGPVATIAPREVRLIRSGIPVSLTCELFITFHELFITFS